MFNAIPLIIRGEKEIMLGILIAIIVMSVISTLLIVFSVRTDVREVLMRK